jgi:hypothetical protein
MANTKRTRSYRSGSRRTSGSGALIDTVRNTLTGVAGSRGRGSRGSRGSSGSGRSNLVSQAGGFVSGLLSGGADSRKRGGRRRR